MDDPLMDAAGRAVSLQEELVAELQRDVNAASMDGQPAPKPEEHGFEMLEADSTAKPGARTLEEAKNIARDAMHAMDSVVEEYRSEITTLLDAKESERRTLAMKRITEIKTRIGA